MTDLGVGSGHSARLAVSRLTCAAANPAYTPTLQQIAADRDWWQLDDGAHYKELATWLREGRPNAAFLMPNANCSTLPSDMNVGPTSSIVEHAERHT
jgi:hypothetical protein